MAVSVELWSSGPLQQMQARNEAMAIGLLCMAGTVDRLILLLHIRLPSQLCRTPKLQVTDLI